MMTMLAEATATAAAPGLDPMTVGTLIGGILITLIGGGVLGKKISDGTKITLTNPQLDVEVREQLVTRAECLACKTDAKSELKEIKGLYDKTVTLLLERDERQSLRTKELADQMHSQIQEMGERDLEGRRRIHDQVNAHDKLIAHIDARTDVSKSISKAAGAIMALANKQPS